MFFDLGGTLIIYENKHSWRELAYLGCERAAPFVTQATGIDISSDKLAATLLEIIDNTVRSHNEDLQEIRLYDLVAEALSDLGAKNVNGLPPKFVEIYYQPTTEQIALEPGAPELLEKLKNAGMKIGLVSNSIFPAEFHKAEMRRFGLLDYFDFTIFSSEYGVRKPNRAIYLKALELAESDPARSVFIGDRALEDVIGPSSLGINAILKYIDGREYSSGVNPYRTIRKLAELEAILLE